MTVSRRRAATCGIAPGVAERRAAWARRALRSGALLAAYLGAVIWLTWPLALHLATRLPDAHGACRFDLLATASILATETQNLAEGRNLLAGSAYHPEPHPIAYAHLALGALPVFAPFFLATGSPAL